eukprot:jgi/Ulvmu1/6384/UM003_0012.1
MLPTRSRLSSTPGRHCNNYAIRKVASKSTQRSGANVTRQAIPILTDEHVNTYWDAVVIGSGVGGLTTATEMARKGAKVLVLEKYIIPGGSAGQFERKGFKFDVGSSMMFGLNDEAGNTNLITRALANAGHRCEAVPDPTQLEYHLPRSPRFPNGLNVPVPRSYEAFLDILIDRFPHEEEGIRGFYGECWEVFNALNKIELRSLEEIRFLMYQFAREPAACLQLLKYLPLNTGDVAERHIRDPELLAFVNAECFLWSTVLARATPMISAGMVLCDRFFGGINYPLGGVGEIPRKLVQGLEEMGSTIAYKAPVDEILSEGSGADMRAVGVRLRDGREVRARCVVSNATRWNTFGGLLPHVPRNEAKFRELYVKAPSFISLHLGVSADCIPAGTECHHIVIEQWDAMQDNRGCLFVSIPSILDPSLCPPGTHTFHAFAQDSIEDYVGLSREEYEALKESRADAIIDRLEAAVFPGLRKSITFREVGSPRTHQKFLGREDGTYGMVPQRPPLGILNMPFNRTDVRGLYCAGDSTFPGQGVNAVVFSGFGAAHCALCDLGMEETWAAVDSAYNSAMTRLRYNA